MAEADGFPNGVIAHADTECSPGQRPRGTRGLPVDPGFNSCVPVMQVEGPVSDSDGESPLCR